MLQCQFLATRGSQIYGLTCPAMIEPIYFFAFLNQFNTDSQL
uniref:Uncharacterized protein n=1 Tax=Anguilla anguilla TaxID=7936 RepID=A0A0E9TNE0_ANGAN